MRAPDEASRASPAHRDGRRGAPESAGSEPWASPGRRRAIDTRLAAIRARLKELSDREVGLDGMRSRTATTRQRVAAARRDAAKAQAAAFEGLAASAEAFRIAAEAHERAARMHDRTAAAGIGDVIGHERQATSHRAAAAADRQRAERALSLLSGHDGSGPAAVVCDEPGEGVGPITAPASPGERDRSLP